jgi:hypothetical protein
VKKQCRSFSKCTSIQPFIKNIWDLNDFHLTDHACVPGFQPFKFPSNIEKFIDSVESFHFADFIKIMFVSFCEVRSSHMCNLGKSAGRREGRTTIWFVSEVKLIYIFSKEKKQQYYQWHHFYYLEVHYLLQNQKYCQHLNYTMKKVKFYKRGCHKFDE